MFSSSQYVALFVLLPEYAQLWLLAAFQESSGLNYRSNVQPTVPDSYEIQTRLARRR